MTERRPSSISSAEKATFAAGPVLPILRARASFTMASRFAVMRAAASSDAVAATWSRPAAYASHSAPSSSLPLERAR